MRGLWIVAAAIAMFLAAAALTQNQYGPAPQSVIVPGSGHAVAIANIRSAAEAAAVLRGIESWIAANFDLPPADEIPTVRFVPKARIAMIRYAALLSVRAAEAPPAQRILDEDTTVAVYVDTERTIYLPEGWTGRTPAEASVLVHEVVHHLQNRAGIKHECAQERERLAYAVQAHWLERSGRTLQQDFELSPFSLLVLTRCMY